MPSLQHNLTKLLQGVEEAKTATNAAFKELCEEIFRNQNLIGQIEKLKQLVTTLTEENDELPKRTLELTENLSPLLSFNTNHR